MTPVEGPFGIGNEPHHLGLSGDNKTLLAGGLFGFVRKHPDIFKFDISNPTTPKYSGTIDAPMSSGTDDFMALPNGNTLITMMGGPAGGEYGRVLELDINNEIVAEWPKDAPADLTPHGISINYERNLMVTSDFLVPASTMTGPVIGRQSLRVWDLKSKVIIRTIHIPTSESLMDLTLIPNDIEDRGYIPSQGGKLFHLNVTDGSFKAVFDYDAVIAASLNSTHRHSSKPHILRFRKDGKRAFMTLYEANRVAMLDTSDPLHPQLLRVIDLGVGAGPHFLLLSHDQTRLIVSDYFVNNVGLGGLVAAGGDYRTHVFQIEESDFHYDPLWYHDGNNFTTGVARPHGLVCV